LKGIPPGYAVRSVKGKICFPEKIGNAPRREKGGPTQGQSGPLVKGVKPTIRESKS